MLVIGGYNKPKIKTKKLLKNLTNKINKNKNHSKRKG
jgi:hypothetical protein